MRLKGFLQFRDEETPDSRSPPRFPLQDNPDNSSLFSTIPAKSLVFRIGAQHHDVKRSGSHSLINYPWPVVRAQQGRHKLTEVGREFLQPAPNCGSFGSGGHSQSYGAKVGVIIPTIVDIAKLLEILSIGGH